MSKEKNTITVIEYGKENRGISFDDFAKGMQDEREALLRPDNPCYLIDQRCVELCENIKTRPNKLYFDVTEILMIVDSVLYCVNRNSPDAWYPANYLLGIVNDPPEYAKTNILYFLCNYQLGLKLSAERAKRHTGKECAELSKELASRLDSVEAFSKMSDENYNFVYEQLKSNVLLEDVYEWINK